MKFKFSLSTVLKVREHQEKIQKQKLAEQVAKKNEINQLQNEVRGKLKSYLDEDTNTESTSAHMIRRKRAHIEQIHQKMSNLNQKMEKVDEKVTEEREKLATAHKSLHIMEKVKEFEKTLYTSKMNKKEQKFMDEIATQSFSR